MFIIKKAVVVLISPLGILLFLLLAGLIAHRFAGLRPWPRRVALAAAAGLLLVTIGPTGEILIAPLEGRHPPLTDLQDIDDDVHIVVLGGGSYHRPDGPITAELSPASLVRLNEGIRLHRKLESSTLVVCGASVGHPGSTAESMAHIAGELGVSSDRIAVAHQARDTYEEALAVGELIEPGTSVILVTSASHMPRAVRLFDRAGVDVIAAPTHYLTSDSLWRPGDLWPSSRNVRRVERALYEYVGLFWITLGGS